MARLQDEPLSTGIKAMHEAVLLGRALLNTGPDAVEQRVLMTEAWEAAGIPADDVSVHVKVVRHGTLVREDHIIVNGTGGGRHAHEQDSSAGSTHTLLVEAGRSPVLDRFRRLHQHLREQLAEARAMERMGGRRPDPGILAWWEFVDAALATAETAGRPDQADAPLTSVADELLPHIRATDPGVIGRLTDVSARLPELADEVRGQGRLTGWPAAALQVCASVPVCIAARFEGPSRFEQLARYLTFALLEGRVSPWQAIYGVTAKAVREGHARALEEVAYGLLAQAEQHRDRALDGPADRDHFSRELFLSTPKASAALRILSLLETFDPGGETELRSTKRTVAEELVVRIEDGLLYTWQNVDDSRTVEEWRRIHRLRRAGDERGVRNALRQGEQSLLRPRSVRSILVGPSRWPHVKEDDW